MSAIRYSKQREAIKDYLKSVTCHPTADTVYANIQKLFPNISLGTVYRNLNFLVEHGEAIQIDCGDGFVHFDGNSVPHNHFFCRSCKKLLDIEMDSISHIDIIANANFPGKIEGHTVLFHGLCGDCCSDLNKNENLKHKSQPPA